jgi:hypothetical protein
MRFAETRQDPPKRLDVVGDRRCRRSRGSDVRVATMYTRVRLGHDIVDSTPSSRKFARPTMHKDGARICAGSTGIRVSCGSRERSLRDRPRSLRRRTHDQTSRRTSMRCEPGEISGARTAAATVDVLPGRMAQLGQDSAPMQRKRQRRRALPGGTPALPRTGRSPPTGLGRDCDFPKVAESGPRRRGSSIDGQLTGEAVDSQPRDQEQAYVSTRSGRSRDAELRSQHGRGCVIRLALPAGDR